MHYKNSPSEGFFSQGHEFWKWERKPHKRKLSTKTNTAPNAPDLRECCRHSSSCWVRLSMDVPSEKHHLTIANANTGKCYTCYLVLRWGVRSGNTWLHLLPSKECTVSAPPSWITSHKGSSHTQTSAHMQQPQHVWLKLLFLFLANYKN